MDPVALASAISAPDSLRTLSRSSTSYSASSDSSANSSFSSGSRHPDDFKGMGSWQDDEDDPNLRPGARGGDPEREERADDPSPLELHSIHSEPDSIVDIVFVHGLDRNPWGISKAGLPNILSDDIRNANTMTVEYDRSIWTTQSANAIQDSARRLVTKLSDVRKKNKAEDRPLIWVAHSLGGWLVKATLVLSSLCDDDKPERDISTSTRGLVFLGTPHRTRTAFGADRTWDRIKFASLGYSAPKVSRKGATPPTPTTNFLQKLSGFTTALEDDCTIFSFYEKHETCTATAPSLLTSSDNALRSRTETVDWLDGNHTTMCRFQGQSDPSYKKVRAAINKIMTMSLPEADSGHAGDFVFQSPSLRAIPQSDMERIVWDFLGSRRLLASESIHSGAESVRMAPSVIAMFTEPVKLREIKRMLGGVPRGPETCFSYVTPADAGQWVTRSKAYRDWYSGKFLLVIQGRSGSGKSLLIKAIIQDLVLKSAGLGAASSHSSPGACLLFHFFSEQPDSTSHWVDMLRQFVLQLLEINPLLARHVQLDQLHHNHHASPDADLWPTWDSKRCHPADGVEDDEHPLAVAAAVRKHRANELNADQLYDAFLSMLRDAEVRSPVLAIHATDTCDVKTQNRICDLVEKLASVSNAKVCLTFGSDTWHEKSLDPTRRLESLVREVSMNLSKAKTAPNETAESKQNTPMPDGDKPIQAEQKAATSGGSFDEPCQPSPKLPSEATTEREAPGPEERNSIATKEKAAFIDVASEESYKDSLRQLSDTAIKSIRKRFGRLSPHDMEHVQSILGFRAQNTYLWVHLVSRISSALDGKASLSDFLSAARSSPGKPFDGVTKWLVEHLLGSKVADQIMALMALLFVLVAARPLALDELTNLLAAEMLGRPVDAMDPQLRLSDHGLPKYLVRRMRDKAATITRKDLDQWKSTEAIQDYLEQHLFSFLAFTQDRHQRIFVSIIHPVVRESFERWIYNLQPELFPIMHAKLADTCLILLSVPAQAKEEFKFDREARMHWPPVEPYIYALKNWHRHLRKCLDRYSSHDIYASLQHRLHDVWVHPAFRHLLAQFSNVNYPHSIDQLDETCLLAALDMLHPSFEPVPTTVRGSKFLDMTVRCAAANSAGRSLAVLRERLYEMDIPDEYDKRVEDYREWAARESVDDDDADDSDVYYDAMSQELPQDPTQSFDPEQHYKLLKSAVAMGDYDSFKQLLYQHRIDKLCLGRLLLLAAQRQNIKTVERILDQGADINFHDVARTYPLHYAAASGYLDLVQLFMRRGASTLLRDGDGLLPIHLAARHNHDQVVKYLVSTSREPTTGNGATAGWTALFFASHTGALSATKILLQYGVDTNRRDHTNRTALHLAASSAATGVVSALLGYGADPNYTDTQGRSPLHLAALGGWETVVSILLKAGADKNACTESGQTPLFFAAKSSNPSIAVVEQLLEAGTDASHCDKRGKTALHKAAKYGSRDMVELLLRCKPKPSPDSAGRMPSDVAIEAQQPLEIIEMLQNWQNQKATDVSMTDDSQATGRQLATSE